MKIKHQVDWAERRVKDYLPIGEQLDAAMKGFIRLKEQGYELPPETENWINSHLDTKAKHPKGE